MKLTINGQIKQFTKEIQTIGHLIEQLNLQEKRFVIEHNGQILKKDNQNEQPLTNGDRLEIVHFVGGG